MPHLVLEHSSNLKPRSLMEELHKVLTSFESVDEAKVKTRSLPFESYLVGGKEDRAFLSLTIQMMEGRSEELLTLILEKLQKKLREFSDNTEFKVAVSTNLVELKKKRYRTSNPE